MNTDCRVAQLYADFSFPSAREMAWPISLAAFSFLNFCFRFSAFRRTLTAIGFRRTWILFIKNEKREP
jgi:hypothetical protein